MSTRPEVRSALEEWLVESVGARSRFGCHSAVTNGHYSRPCNERRAQPRAAQGQTLGRSHCSSGRAGGAAGGPRSGSGATAHRVLRRVPPVGNRSGRVDGGVRGRVAAQVRVPTLHAPRRGNDDIAGIAEAVERRFRRQLAEEQSDDSPETFESAGRLSRRRPVSIPRPASPNGSPIDRSCWWSTADRCRRPPRSESCKSLAIDDVAVIGLAKRLEEVWTPVDDEPLILPRGSQALYLLQRVRDEAHRFAITFQRQRRGQRAKASALDAIPGLGEVRKRALLARFGSVRRLREATVEEISEVPGIGPKTAAGISGPAGAESRPRRRTGSGKHRDW